MSQDEIAALSQDFVSVALVVMLAACALLAVDLAGRIGAARARRAGSATGAQSVLVGAGAPTSADEDPNSTIDGPADAPIGGPIEPGDTTERTEHQPGGTRAFRAGIASTMLGTALLTVGVVSRAIGTGRAPWGNMYEFSITGSLITLLVLLVMLRTPVGRTLAVWVAGVVSLILIAAVTVLYVPPGELVPALRHYWMILHVGVTVIAFGLFTAAAVVSVLQIVAERRAPTTRTAALPTADRLDRLAYRIIAVGFPLWTLGPLILGAIWAEVSWGRYWGWDPKEVWAFISWVIYAAYLHARATAGWKGRRASIISLIGFATVLFSYYGVNLFFGGLHAYDGL